MCCGHMTNDNPSCLSSLTGHGTWDEVDWLALTKCLHKYFTRTKYPARFYHHLKGHVKVFLNIFFETLFIVCPSEFRASV